MIVTTVSAALAAALLTATPPVANREVELPPPPVLVQRPPAPAAGASLWMGLGARDGHWTDSGAETADPSVGSELLLAWTPGHHRLSLSVGLDRYRRSWVQPQIDPITGSAARRTVDESLWDVRLRYGIELLHLAGVERTTLDAVLGAGLLYADDEILKASAIPVGAGLRVAHRLGEGLAAYAEGFGAFAAGATDARDASVFGTLLAAYDYGAGVEWRLASANIQLGYTGEAHVFEHAKRLRNGLGVRVALGF
jgi:hypothetical protein